MSAAARLAPLLLAGLASGCDRAPATDAEPADPGPPPPQATGRLAEPPTLVLVTIDTLRREHLGCYGYFRPTSPRLDAFAAEGLIFERALAPMASTLPSHLTMLTGLYPHQHGMNSNRRGASVSFTSELGRLSAAAVLRDAGYRTAGFVSAPPLAARTGIGTGFQTYEAPHNSAAEGSSLSAGERNEAVLAWLDEHAPEPGPFFLWVHYFDPHEPNDPPPPYDGMFATDERQLAWIRSRGIDPERLSARYAGSKRVERHFFPPERGNRGGRGPLTIERIAELMNRYDGEVRYTDDRFGELLDALRRHGRYDDALIVVVADHGQSLGENDWFGHGTPTNLNCFVPLVVRLPRALAQPPGRVGALVSLADLMPTVLARFELPGSDLLRGQFEGEDVLSGDFARDSALAARTADELADGETGRVFALLSGSWKLLHRPEGRDELYDLAGAGEFVDVLPSRPEVAARLAEEVRAILGRKPALLEDEEEADEELLRRLDELGYGGDAEAEEDG